MPVVLEALINEFLFVENQFFHLLRLSWVEPAIAAKGCLGKKNIFISEFSQEITNPVNTYAG